jgi:hypothetical protein
VGGLLVGVEVGMQHVVRVGFAGVDVGGVPVGAQGIQDSGQAGAFVRGEIESEGDETGHSGPPWGGSSKGGVETGITELGIPGVTEIEHRGHRVRTPAESKYSGTVAGRHYSDKVSSSCSKWAGDPSVVFGVLG